MGFIPNAGPVLAIVGFILILIAVKYIADLVGDQSIFINMIISVALAIIGIIVLRRKKSEEKLSESMSLFHSSAKMLSDRRPSLEGGFPPMVIEISIGICNTTDVQGPQSITLNKTSAFTGIGMGIGFGTGMSHSKGHISLMRFLWHRNGKRQVFQEQVGLEVKVR